MRRGVAVCHRGGGGGHLEKLLPPELVDVAPMFLNGIGPSANLSDNYTQARTPPPPNTHTHHQLSVTGMQVDHASSTTSRELAVTDQ